MRLTGDDARLNHWDDEISAGEGARRGHRGKGESKDGGGAHVRCSPSLLFPASATAAFPFLETRPTRCGRRIARAVRDSLHVQRLLSKLPSRCEGLQTTRAEMQLDDSRECVNGCCLLRSAATARQAAAYEVSCQGYFNNQLPVLQDDMA
ncbi:hypothetical protein BD311DRAFT_346622 [Dichomitus squalens]|uniref:Uncharacterized protein n=1 Tax=Dichomitus squalens TaxID=114155 RepID=A0A4Q9N5R0_9APHY|nr:hypothetical protein BD311DRAFT_346622 [Dichomitus squalens]